MAQSTSGLLLAFLGLPGSGKSTVASALAKLCAGQVFLEPEEDLWPDAVRRREECGYLTAITWFRAMRVPQLFEARRLADAGHLAIVDSYYDKVVHHYLGKRGMEWLIPANDAYFDTARTLARSDYALLPNADCLIVLELTEPEWLTLLAQRGRQLDHQEGLLKSFHTQSYFVAAAEQYCHDHGAVLVRVRRILTSPTDQARAISLELGRLSLLPNSP